MWAHIEKCFEADFAKKDKNRDLELPLDFLYKINYMLHNQNRFEVYLMDFCEIVVTDAIKADFVSKQTLRGGKVSPWYEYEGDLLIKPMQKDVYKLALNLFHKCIVLSDILRQEKIKNKSLTFDDVQWRDHYFLKDDASKY